MNYEISLSNKIPVVICKSVNHCFHVSRQFFLSRWLELRPQAIRVSQMSWSSSSCRVLSTWRMLRWDVNLFRRSKGIESDRTWYGALKLGSLESGGILHSLHRWFSSCIRPWVCKLDWSNGVSSAGMLNRYSAALIYFTWQGRLQIGWAASWNSGDWQRRPVDLGQTGSDVPKRDRRRKLSVSILVATMTMIQKQWQDWVSRANT